MESKKQLMDLIARSAVDCREYLSELFRYMPESFAREFQCLEVKKNENILVAGSECNAVYALLSGSVTGIEHHGRGRIYAFLDFTKVYIIGDFELYSGHSEYSITIRAQQDCKLLKISAGSYLRWIQRDEHALILRLNNILNSFMFERTYEREHLFVGSKERLVNFLLRLYEKEHGERSGRYKVELTQMELADRLGCNIRSIQRSIVSLEKEGVISSESGKIKISKEQYGMLQQYENEKEES